MTKAQPISSTTLWSTIVGRYDNRKVITHKIQKHVTENKDDNISHTTPMPENKEAQTPPDPISEMECEPVMTFIPLCNVYYNVTGPANIYILNDKIHRSGGPAIEYMNGDFVWYKNGKIHREGDNPAIQTKYYKSWYNRGEIHRDGDNPAYITNDGVKMWYKYGLIHRDDDLPAVEKPMEKIWYRNGLCHRDNNLPAVEYSSGDKEWWVDGKIINSED